MIDTLLKAYPWFDHVEGPKFAEMERSVHRSFGHWLFLPGVFSSWHAVKNCEEIWAIHSGGLLVHLLTPEGEHKVHRLGMKISEGEQPVITVPKGHWQAAEISDGLPFAFGSNVCVPGFLYSEFELGKREELLAEFPQHAEVITRLTRI